jgi:predicted MFS family arabinose efflux permease
MLPTQLPYLIINTLGGKPQSVGFIIATAMIFNAIVASQYSKIKAIFSYTHIYIMTFSLFGVGLFIISIASNLSTLYYSTAFLGSAFGLLFVNTNAWFLSSVTKNQRGKASGILTSSFFLGQFSSPFIFQPIIEVYQIQGLFQIVSYFAIFISIALLFMIKIKQYKKQD